MQIGSKANNSANVKSSMSVNYGIRDNTTVGVRKNEHLNTLDIYISTNYFNRFVRKIKYPINIVIKLQLATNAINLLSLMKKIILIFYIKLFLNIRFDLRQF